jgi:hypothetical protein
VSVYMACVSPCDMACQPSAWGKMLKIGTQGVGTGSDFFYQAPYIKGYLSVLSLLFQGMVGGQHRTSPFAGELLAVSFVAENS